VRKSSRSWSYRSVALAMGVSRSTEAVTLESPKKKCKTVAMKTSGSSGTFWRWIVFGKCRLHTLTNRGMTETRRFGSTTAIYAESWSLIDLFEEDCELKVKPTSSIISSSVY
jgi:hypothetical protein